MVLGPAVREGHDVEMVLGPAVREGHDVEMVLVPAVREGQEAEALFRCECSGCSVHEVFLLLRDAAYSLCGLSKKQRRGQRKHVINDLRKMHELVSGLEYEFELKSMIAEIELAAAD